MAHAVRQFSRQPRPADLGIYEPLRGLLYPHPRGSSEDVRWLSVPPTFMNTVTDRPFIVHKVFADELSMPPPLEAIVLLGTRKSNHQVKNLNSALADSVKRSRARKSWVDPDAKLVADPMSLSGACTLAWAKARRAAKPARWISAIVGVRVPHIAAVGHAVVFVADTVKRCVYLFDPDAVYDDPTDFCLASTVVALMQRFLADSGLPADFEWEHRYVLSECVCTAPQAIQNSAESRGINLAGVDTCSAWCVMFLHLFALQRAASVTPLTVARAMVDPAVRPHLRQVVARYGAWLSHIDTSRDPTRKRIIAQWHAMNDSQRLGRYVPARPERTPRAPSARAASR